MNDLISRQAVIDEEDQLKFYYVESIDDYWIGRRVDNFYYADWHKGLGFVWSKSRYLPWGEHVTNEKTLWKEHTYPSEPVEMPFTDWIVGFVKKYFADRQQGGWIPCSERLPEEQEWLGTKMFGTTISDEICITFDDNGKRFVKVMSLQNRELSDSDKKMMDVFHKGWKMLAWMPLPEPWKGADNEANRR